MKKAAGFLLLVGVASLLLVGCSSRSQPIEAAEDGANILPDSEGDVSYVEPEPTPIPGSVLEEYCVGQGYEFAEESTPENCDEFYVCIFPDGSKCKAREFMAGACSPEFSYCASMGGALSRGDQIGECTLANGSVCSELAYWLGECSGE
jgi:putative hemolysin